LLKGVNYFHWISRSYLQLWIKCFHESVHYRRHFVMNLSRLLQLVSNLSLVRKAWVCDLAQHMRYICTRLALRYVTAGFFFVRVCAALCFPSKPYTSLCSKSYGYCRTRVTTTKLLKHHKPVARSLGIWGVGVGMRCVRGLYTIR
jgi:hypothetical protein